MNRHTATLVQISPLQMRQGLFFSLALLLTLIAGQLHHSWQVAEEAREVVFRAESLVKAPAPALTTLMQSRPAATNAAQVDGNTPRDRWVF
ncbi:MULTISPECIES: hypothetical protein [Pseudomonas]|uniref:Uncharacterized protein n=1 Tax=Pseudomonas sp. Hg7Tf TaxID=3236988 RepID=A0AB39HYE9_9PSED|nr:MULTISPECIES: hypothetical protein [Pseudomonas]KJK06876.1 hypothetical protein UB47_15445 [Pseudomonas sp. 5]MDD1977444.1 hypothetical protein [Pseudomonas putida]MDH2560707.1 hypothetical protein [Pseudomonas sp. Hg5Tf]QYX46533.1 hypothetical protein K3F43_17735 [Pseudomonas sp. S11A 273]